MQEDSAPAVRKGGRQRLFAVPMGSTIGAKMPRERAAEFHDIAKAAGLTDSELVRRILLAWLNDHRRLNNPSRKRS